MALRRILTETQALERTLDAVTRRLQNVLLDDPPGNGQAAQELRAERAAIKAQLP